MPTVSSSRQPYDVAAVHVGRRDVLVQVVAAVAVLLPYVVGTLERGRDPAEATFAEGELHVGELVEDVRQQERDERRPRADRHQHRRHGMRRIVRSASASNRTTRCACRSRAPCPAPRPRTGPTSGRTPTADPSGAGFSGKLIARAPARPCARLRARTSPRPTAARSPSGSADRARTRTTRRSRSRCTPRRRPERAHGRRVATNRVPAKRGNVGKQSCAWTPSASMSATRSFGEKQPGRIAS